MTRTIANLPTLAEMQATRRPQPKGSSPSRLERKIAAEKDDAKQLAQWRKAVWDRDKGRCVHCERKVIHTLTRQANRGEVHHLRGRNVTPADRYTVENAVLLCALCHEKAQRHQIQIRM